MIIAERGSRPTIFLENAEEQEYVIESAVVISAEVTFINNNFSNETSSVDR